MGNNRKKLLYLLGFILFSLISCWATAESLHLLLPTIPYVFCILIAAGFFVLASLGSKLIVDSLNTSIYMSKRGLKLLTGIVMVIIFWLIFSFPTNTHTFFYRNAAPEKIDTDISVTQGYLDQLATGTKIEDRIKAEKAKFNADLNVKKYNLLHEIENPNNPGFGPESLKALDELNKLLDSDMKPLSGNVETFSQIKAAVDIYGSKIEDLRKVKLDKIESDIRNSNLPQIKDEARKRRDALVSVKKRIADGTLDINDAQDAKAITDEINRSYTVVMKYKNLVSFQSREEELRYSDPKIASEATRMKSVIDVWRDYTDGKYAGRGFLTWILASILVDIAAFAFFDLAFSNKNE